MIDQYTWIEEQFRQDENVEFICDIFGIEHPRLLNKKDFFWFLSDIYTMGVQYGDRTGLCDMLIEKSSEPIKDQLASLAEYAAKKGVKYEDYAALNLKQTKIDINSNLR